MKSSVLLVVASIHLGGSYYNQTSLSSVLSTFEAQLTVPRRKDAEQTAPVTTTAPAATPLLRADDTSRDMPADATLTPADATPTPATVASVDTSSTAIQVLADNSTVDEPADSPLLPENVASVDTSSAVIQVDKESSAKSTSTAVTKLLAETSTMSTEPAVTRSTTRALPAVQACLRSVQDCPSSVRSAKMRTLPPEQCTSWQTQDHLTSGRSKKFPSSRT